MCQSAACMHFIVGMGGHDLKKDVMPRVSKAIASLAVDHQQLRSIMTQGSVSSSMVSGRRPVTVVKCCWRCGNRCEILSAKIKPSRGFLPSKSMHRFLNERNNQSEHMNMFVKARPSSGCLPCFPQDVRAAPFLSFLPANVWTGSCGWIGWWFVGPMILKKHAFHRWVVSNPGRCSTLLYIQSYTLPPGLNTCANETPPYWHWKERIGWKTPLVTDVVWL